MPLTFHEISFIPVKLRRPRRLGKIFSDRDRQIFSRCDVSPVGSRWTASPNRKLLELRVDLRYGRDSKFFCPTPARTTEGRIILHQIQPMIEVKNLTKRFGPKNGGRQYLIRGEKGGSPRLPRPQRCRKSTTMRMITGYFPPTSRDDPDRGRRCPRRPDRCQVEDRIPPGECAALHRHDGLELPQVLRRRCAGSPALASTQASSAPSTCCFLDAVRHQSIDTLSKGYRHRTCFAQAIIHDPDILILDEPTDGLDPNQKHEMRRLIRRMGEEKAIIFSTHILEEVDAACSRAMIIDQGRVKADGTPEELRAKDPESGHRHGHHLRPAGQRHPPRVRETRRRRERRRDQSHRCLAARADHPDKIWRGTAR